ncbi:hypothetical protein ABBQ32_006805 [Trebouxia sp. C0010 RCD-2024]
MSSNSKTSVSKAQNEQHKRILGQLLKLEANRRCCDCSARGPTWASVNLGLFVCLNCSGIHRSLGTHLSKVRSTTLDTWLPEQVEFISKLGNIRANAYWEARLPQGFRRPAEGDMSALKEFITEKYQNQAYSSRDYDGPPNIDNYFNHPFMKQVDAPSAVASPTADSQASDKAPAGSGPPSPPVNRAASPESLRRPARNSIRGIHAAPAPVPAPAAAAPRADLMDLLSLDDTAAPAEQAAASATDSDGDWAAFMTASAAQPEAAPAAAPAAAVVSHDSGWDAFQGSEVATPAGTTAAAAVPFDPFGESQPVGAAPLGQQAAGAPAAGVGASQSMPPKHAAKKSADDIMKMFDTPQQSAFAQFPAHGMSQGQAGAMPGGFAMQQGLTYGLTPQQQMQAQHLYAAQQMQLAGGRQPAAYGAVQMPAQAGDLWTQQQPSSFTPSFPHVPQFSSVAGPSGFP